MGLQEDFIKFRENQIMRATTHQVTSMILWAIRNNGLEKTLEDLQKNCVPWANITPWTETNYQGFLTTIRNMNKI